jgi:hypothetical protein
MFLLSSHAVQRQSTARRVTNAWKQRPTVVRQAMLVRASGEFEYNRSNEERQ